MRHMPMGSVVVLLDVLPTAPLPKLDASPELIVVDSIQGTLPAPRPPVLSDGPIGNRRERRDRKFGR